MQFKFEGLNGVFSVCAINVFHSPVRTVVLATETPDNPGTSVTNFAEYLATLVCRKYNISPMELVWVEHYPSQPSDDDYPNSGRWAVVSFGWDWRRNGFTHPRWAHHSREDFEDLTTGCKPWVPA